MNEQNFVLPVRGTVAILIALCTTVIVFWVYQDSRSLSALWGLVGYLFAAFTLNDDTDTKTTTRTEDKKDVVDMLEPVKVQ